MMHATSLLCFLIFFLLANNAKADEPIHVLLIGDSLAFGLARPITKEASKHNVVIHTYAMGGSSTREWANVRPWLKGALRRWHPKWVFVVLGTNDYFIPAWRKAFPQNAKKIVDKAHKHNANVIWLTPPRIDINTDFIYEGARQSCDFVFDYRNVTVPLWADKHGPRVHPSIEGSTQWGYLIMQQFDKEVKHEKDSKETGS